MNCTEKTERQCTIPGCGGPLHSKGKCRFHYQQAWDAANPRRQREAKRITRINGPCKLKLAQDAYMNAIGIEAKLRWRRTLNALEGIQA